jgi:hypothetical protein
MKYGGPASAVALAGSVFLFSSIPSLAGYLLHPYSF